MRRGAVWFALIGIVLLIAGSLSEILCVGHNMRSPYAPQTEAVDLGGATGADSV